MGVLEGHLGTVSSAGGWPADVTRLLEEHHLAAWSDVPGRRTQFGVGLAAFLQGLPQSEVCTLHGRFITDLESFCYQLERQVPGPALERRIEGRRGVEALIRTHDGYACRAPGKFRYYVWHDADALLKHNRALFGRLAEALVGVAAEGEFAGDDVLLVQRAVFIGGVALEEYARDERGRLRSWTEDVGVASEPYWQVVTGLERPPVLAYQIDLLAQS